MGTPVLQPHLPCVVSCTAPQFFPLRCPPNKLDPGASPGYVSVTAKIVVSTRAGKDLLFVCALRLFFCHTQTLRQTTTPPPVTPQFLFVATATLLHTPGQRQTGEGNKYRPEPQKHQQTTQDSLQRVPVESFCSEILDFYYGLLIADVSNYCLSLLLVQINVIRYPVP